MKPIPNFAEREQALALTFPPNPDTVAEPLDYLRETKPLSDVDRKKVLYDNAMELIAPAKG